MKRDRKPTKRVMNDAYERGYAARLIATADRYRRCTAFPTALERHAYDAGWRDAALDSAPAPTQSPEVPA